MPRLNMGVVKADHQVGINAAAVAVAENNTNPLLMDKTFAIRPVMKMLDPIHGLIKRQ